MKTEPTSADIEPENLFILIGLIAIKQLFWQKSRKKIDHLSESLKQQTEFLAPGRLLLQ